MFCCSDTMSDYYRRLLLSTFHGSSQENFSCPTPLSERRSESNPGMNNHILVMNTVAIRKAGGWVIWFIYDFSTANHSDSSSERFLPYLSNATHLPPTEGRSIRWRFYLYTLFRPGSSSLIGTKPQ